MLTVEKLLNGYDKSMQFKKEITPELLQNLENTAKIVSEFLKFVGVIESKIVITSGWRPQAVNEATANSAKKSNHILGLAVDLADPQNNLFKAFMTDENLSKAQELGIYFENPLHTKNWVHLQIVTPKSGSRVFLANGNQPTNPDVLKRLSVNIESINERFK